MVRKANDRNVEVAEHKFGADGFITVRHMINSDEELNGKGRVFAHTTLLPGCGIGFHMHNGDSEIYYIYSGTGEFNDNGTIRVRRRHHVHALRHRACHGEHRRRAA